MSIENRLAAKKRSAKARRNAKIKSAVELGVIILIPVIILIVVLVIYNNSIPQYSRYLDKEGNIKGYNVSKNVDLADLDAMGITYDKYLPTDAEIEDRIVSDLKSAVEAEEKAAAEATPTPAEGGDKTEGGDGKTEGDNGATTEGDGSTSSNSTTEDGDADASKEPTATPAPDGDTTDTTGTTGDTTGTTGDTTGEVSDTADGEKKDSEKTEEEKAAEEAAAKAAEKAKYIAMFTNENVEKYFADKLGEKYDHTTDGYRKYLTESMQLSNFNTNVQEDVLKYLEENSTIKKMPSNRFMKLWKKLERQEWENTYNSWMSIYTANNYATVPIYDFFDNRKDKSGMSSEEYFEDRVKTGAEERVKTTVLLLAAFDKLGFTYDKSEADKYIEESFVSSSQTLEDARKEYGDEYMILAWKTSKALKTLVDRIHVEPTDE